MTVRIISLMPTLQQLKDKTVPFTADFGDIQITGEARVGIITRAIKDDLKRIGEKVEDKEKLTQEESDYMYGLGAQILKSWDLTEEDGKPCPTDADFLADSLGDFYFSKVLGAMMEALNPNASNGDGA
jgi:hypothetical protein